jgi:hypothetical protein
MWIGARGRCVYAHPAFHQLSRCTPTCTRTRTNEHSPDRRVRALYHNCTKHEKTDSGKISFGGFADATLWVIPLPSPIPPRSWCYESQASESARAQFKLRGRTVAVASLHSCSKAQNEFFSFLISEFWVLTLKMWSLLTHLLYLLLYSYFHYFSDMGEWGCWHNEENITFCWLFRAVLKHMISHIVVSIVSNKVQNVRSRQIWIICTKRSLILTLAEN